MPVSVDPVIVERLPLGVPDTTLGVVTLNRPVQKHPVDWGAIGAMQVAMNELAGDAAVRASAVIGAGDARAQCRGRSREVAVAGVPDQYRGETVKAYASLKHGHILGEQELIDFCKKRKVACRYPRVVEFVDERPETVTGKITRCALHKIKR